MLTKISAGYFLIEVNPLIKNRLCEQETDLAIQPITVIFTGFKKCLMRDTILAVIDFFYPPFRRFISIQTFRYIACGGGNTLLDIFIYFIAYHYILFEKVLHTPVVAISPYIAAFLIAFMISFPTGFYLNRSIVFSGSTLRGRVQLIRYFMLVIVCILLNYIFIKLFVERFGLYPTLAKILTTIIVVSFSYLTQKRFTFKIAKEADLPK